MLNISLSETRWLVNSRRLIVALQRSFLLLSIPSILFLCMTAPLRSQVLSEEVKAIQQAQFDDIDQYLDRQVARAESIRQAYWRRDLSSIARYKESIEPYREVLFEMLGGDTYSESPLAPREELLAEFPTHKAYRVWITAFDDVRTYGILLVPNGQRPFPALIAVHGMAGTPEGVTGLTGDMDYHNRFGLQAVKRQYVVFAPVNMNSAAKRSWLDRKAIMVRQRLQALEQYKLIRLVDYLEQRPDVDGERIGAYGISWGGRTVMNLAALDPRIAATAISGHFNDLVSKMLKPSPHYTAYIETREAYAFFWGHAQRFTDADVVSLICPRPVFIEQGREDRVAYWKMSERAFVEVKEIYNELGIGERAQYEMFAGAHEVFGGRTFDFFERWLMREARQ